MKSSRSTKLPLAKRTRYEDLPPLAVGIAVSGEELGEWERARRKLGVSMETMIRWAVTDYIASHCPPKTREGK